MTSWQLQDLLPGLYVGAWITLLAAALRRWYDPVPRRLWAVLALVLLVLLGPVLLAGYRLLPLGELLQYPPYQRLAPSWPSSNSLQHDLLRVLYPTQVQAQQALRAGSGCLVAGETVGRSVGTRTVGASCRVPDGAARGGDGAAGAPRTAF